MIRAYCPQDLSQITAIAIKNFPDIPITEALISEKISSETFVEEVNGEILGFLIAASRKETAYIRLMGVKNSRKGIGTLLLKEFENRMKNFKIFSVGDSPANYFLPGVDCRSTDALCFFEKHHYERMLTNYNLICNLREFKSTLPLDVEIRRAESSDQNPVLEFLETNFPAWVPEAKACFGNNPISLFIAMKNSKVIGFSAYQGNNKTLPWFGPMGTLPECRGQGIGKILCEMCLESLRLQGFSNAIIPWTSTVRFYHKVCEAKVDRVLFVMRKKNS